MRKHKGSGMIELILVMILLMLFGLSTFMLVVSGSNAYATTVSERDNLADRRVALSYIDNKIRQHDQQKAVEVRKNKLNGGVAIVLKEGQGENAFETWIYENDGLLREAYLKKGVPLSDDMSFEICKIDHFDVRREKNLLYVQVGRKKGNEMNSSEIIIKLNSDR